MVQVQGRADLLDIVRDTAPDADTIYLDRRIVRRSEANGDRLVSRLTEMQSAAYRDRALRD